ncbi:hypothetical protein ACR6C2_25840 [Streptomyces sp. INA 01156]
MATDMLTVQELNDLRLGTLKTSVDDWRTMVGRLEKLATGGDGQVSAKDLQKKAYAADWVGVNATVSRQFVTRTAAQFDDATSEAKSVLAVLSDAHAAFTQHKQELRTAIDELAKRSIYVNGNGSVIASAPPPAVAGKADIPRPTDQELEVAQRRITRILWEATETDRIAARALRLLAKDKYDFTDQGSTGLEDADHDQGRADAEYWRKEIAKGDVEDWSEAKLARFNETLKNHRDNPAFTDNLVLDLGADGTLQFWRDLADPRERPEGDRASSSVTSRRTSACLSPPPPTAPHRRWRRGRGPHCRRRQGVRARRHHDEGVRLPDHEQPHGQGEVRRGLPGRLLQGHAHLRGEEGVQPRLDLG